MMKKINIGLPLAITLILLTALSCKPGVGDTVVARAIVVGDRIPVLSKPIRTGVVLATFGRNKVIEIVKKGIPDLKFGKKTLWYSVKLDKEKFGYLSYDEEILRGNIASFETLSGDSNYALVKTRGVRLRKKPGLKFAGKISLDKGSLVEVLRKGLIPLRSRSKKLDYWLEVKTPAGATGYLLSSFVERGTQQELLNSYKGGEELEGWVKINKDNVTFYSAPGVLFPKHDDEVDENGVCARPAKYLGIGEMIKVEARGKKDGIEYYNFVEYINEDEMDSYEPECELKGWVRKTDVEYFPDLYKYSLEKANSKLPRPLLDALNKALEGDLNVFETGHFILPSNTEKGPEKSSEQPATSDKTSDEVSVAPAKKQFHIIKAIRGAGKKRKVTRGIVALETAGEFEVVGTYGGFNEVPGGYGTSILDMDGDGKYEIFDMSSTRSEVTYNLYVYDGKTYKELLSLNNMGVLRGIDKDEDLEEDPGELDLLVTVKGEYVLLRDAFGLKKAPFSAKYRKKKYRALKYSKGKLGEVDVTKLKFDYKSLLKGKSY